MDHEAEVERLGRIIRHLTWDAEGARMLRRLPKDVADIIMDEAATHGVTVAGILFAYNREPAVIEATRAATVRVRALRRGDKPRFTWKAIARQFGRTNGTTMVHAAQRYQAKKS